MVPQLIGLEEHFTARAVADRPSATAIPTEIYPKSVFDNLLDIGETRIKAMDKGNMTIQVVSHIPAIEPLEICQAANNQLFEAIQAKAANGRLRGFAFLPMGQPDAIPDELERCVIELGFVGTLISNHAHGVFYDDHAYWPMFAKAQELDVPIYLHPCPTDDWKRFEGKYDRAIQVLIAGPGLCWHTEVAMHFLRLYGSGLFDQYPKLKLVLGHNGESLPFWLERADRMLTRRWGTHKRNFMAVWNENVWITTSGMWDLASLRCCLDVVKPDRILYSELLDQTSTFKT